MTVTYAEALERVVSGLKEGSEHVCAGMTEPDEDWMPVLLVCRDDGNLIVAGLDSRFMGDEESKEALSMVVIPGMIFMHDGIAAGLLSSAWMVDHPRADIDQSGRAWSEIRPSQDPRRKEVVHISAQAGDNTHWMATAEIIRSPTTPPMLSEWTDITGKGAEQAGRMPDAIRRGLAMVAEPE